MNAGNESHERLSHLKHYDVEGSNVEFIGSDIDRKLKHKTAETEPAWEGAGQQVGLAVWRIENFEVVRWPRTQYGSFYDGDSYIVLHTFKTSPDADSLSYDVHFWLGNETTQDEAGTAAYKAVELDDFLTGAATQYREVQGSESDRFLHLFPRLNILRGGVRSGFKHVETEETTLFRLLHVKGTAHNLIVREVEPRVESLNCGDVFVLDQQRKLRVWQGEKSSPMEKAKAASFCAELSSEREGQTETEVLSQNESRSLLFIQALGGDVRSPIASESADIASPNSARKASLRPKRLFRLSDASGQLMFDLVKNGVNVRRSDFGSEDVYIYDTGLQVYVWQGRGASSSEKASWLKVAQAYLTTLDGPAWRNPIAKVVEGAEGPAFVAALDG